MHLRRSLPQIAPMLLGAALLASPLAAIGAHAQTAQDAQAEADARDAAAQQQARQEARSKAPPPAIPGAVSDDQTMSSHINSDMEPNAALFDAINRGDLVAAKEALGRGADIESHNVLGQTPLDMAIDLNHNDITFLLLSMRSNDAVPTATQVASNAPAGKSAKGADAGRRKGGRIIRTADRSTGTRFASDGGVPKPEIGFLGFGGS